MFVRILNILLELRQKTIELEIIQQELSQHNQMNETEINALIELINQIKESLTNDQQRVQIINIVNASLQNKLQQVRESNSNTDNFLNYQLQCNQNNIGIAILNNQGQFILTDQLTRDILELNSNVKLEEATFFSLISNVSSSKLKQQLNDCCLLQSGKEKESFELAIYSKRNKKKSLQYLKQIAKQKKKNKQKKFKTQNKEEHIEKAFIIMAKYLKSVQITIKKVNLQLHEDFIEFFKGSKDILLHNQSILEQNKIYQVAICEIQEMNGQINFSVEDLLSDPYIKKNEMKWIKKVRKLGGQEQAYEDFL
ncbi:unnamed protein product [Paramecium sonneborni]|uniref:Uncharacterized protein n=1 Tax=Paramecium sonneborni TaxID=65129 RepID=A0A8S1RH60_9CILI|nr:unnamed protein product [Paramecium sonneborni]